MSAERMLLCVSYLVLLNDPITSLSLEGCAYAVRAPITKCRTKGITANTSNR